jgi:hypothetical protein
MSITCKQATDYISRHEESKLTLRQRYQLWKHLAVCSLCQLFYKQNTLMVQALKHTETHETESLSEADKQAILKAMQSDTSPEE